MRIEAGMGKQVRVFLNERSGADSTSADQLTALFAQHGCTCAFSLVKPGLDVGALARSEPKEVRFVAAGGDGTVNAVASAVVGSGRGMGVLPCGTLNHFARDLGLPLVLEDAVRVAAGDHMACVDIAAVNGHMFVNNSSLGFYPSMVSERERMKKSGWNKWASLVIASTRSFVRFRRLHVELEVDGEVRHCATPFLFVGNNEYCFDAGRLGRREHLDRGLLSVSLAPGASRLSMLGMVGASLIGRSREANGFQEYLVRSITVTVRGRRPRVSLDGEVRRLECPLQYAIRPGALTVFCATPEPS